MLCAHCRQFGVVIYIMVTGLALCPNYYRQYKNKYDFYGDVHYEIVNDTKIDLKTKIFLDYMLKLEAGDRPSMSRILKNKWFKQYNVNELYEKKIKAPWKPILSYSKENDDFCMKMYWKSFATLHFKLIDLFWNQNQPMLKDGK
jgi:hypothetical protein